MPAQNSNVASDAASEVTLLADNASTYSRAETLTDANSTSRSANLLNRLRNPRGNPSSSSATAPRAPQVPHTSGSDPIKNWEARHFTSM